MKTINCAECNVVYEYEPNPKYPDKRKYCANCSEKKKASWNEKKEEVPTASSSSETTTETTQESKNGYQKDYPKPAKTYELTDGNIRIGALNAAIAWKENLPDLQSLWNTVKDFEEYIRNGK